MKISKLKTVNLDSLVPVMESAQESTIGPKGDQGDPGPKGDQGL